MYSLASISRLSGTFLDCKQVMVSLLFLAKWFATSTFLGISLGSCTPS